MSDVIARAALKGMVRWWLLIVMIALVSGAVAGVLASRQPDLYTAEVGIVPNRARFDAWMYDFPAAGGNAAIAGAAASVAAASFAERRQTLAQLVKNADVEQAVQTELGDRLPPGLREPGALLPLVQGKLASKGELITIHVDAPTAQTATLVVSAWSRAYQQKADELFGPATIAAGAALGNEREVSIATTHAVAEMRPRRLASVVGVFAAVGLLLASIVAAAAEAIPAARRSSIREAAERAAAVTLG